MTLEYSQDLIGRYQVEMLIGIWSRNNKPLAERTINVRVETAVDFLNWAADKGLRVPMSIPKIQRTYTSSNLHNSFGYEFKTVATRQGKLRESKRHLGFPSTEEIAAWYTRLSRRPVRGITEALIAELILETAIRREEAACWRIDTLPLAPADWRIVNPQAALEHQVVLVDLRFGTKGKEYGRDHDDKIGPTGTIRLPLLLARKLHLYRETQRAKSLALAVRRGRTVVEQKRIRDETVHLFLKPRTGTRYTGDNIYEFWRSAAPPKGWSPHRARDYWACTLLWRRMERQRELLEMALKTKIDAIVLQALQSNVLSIIQLEIQPQLRHASQETTMIYLQWVADQLGINLNLHERWIAELWEGAEEVEP
ncbi:hypothetical protein C4K04_4777 [Pseudomonas chlororaphis]|uniref:Integrase n=1 Tax=Pseudomonas chlororaphis TaxID=587753 RepID=A0A3G7TVJ8_9PSED|nr:hypothetical protein [Pseudomonas chlororaphis]AZE50432.1 hypothetical protein C4K04_4777 [Pseudomonas chlororaphis]